MANTNLTPTNLIKQAAMMQADLNGAADMLNGATGFLFACTMPDGSIKWTAGGDLLGYDSKTMGAAMRLYVEAQDSALGKFKWKR